MIVDIIFLAVIKVVGFFTQWLPADPTSGGVVELPWGLDEWVVIGVQGYKAIAQFFPPFNTILTVFLVYFGFRIALRILRAVPILGRTLS